MKKLITLLLFSLLFVAVRADDTGFIQAQLNAGNYTMPTGHADWHISGNLLVTHAFHMNGNTIIASQTTGAAIRLTTAGASIDNGTITGPWVYTTAGNTNGVTGIRILADNCTVSNVTISQFSAYGILIGAYNNPTVTGSTVTKTGYIGLYFDAETANTHNGTVTNNTFDRSMLNPATVNGLAIGIRASTSNPAYSTSNWTITGNTVKMPALPANWAAEGIEVRYMNNAVIGNNTFIGGSIGISVVRSGNILVSGNNVSNSQLECIEFASSSNSATLNNTVNGSAGVGILLDGYGTSPFYTPACTNIALNGDNIRNTVNAAIEVEKNNSFITISGADMTTLNKGIDILQSDHITIVGAKVDGGHHANTSGIFLDKCKGNMTVIGGQLINVSCGLNAYNDNSVAGISLTDNITFSGVSFAGTTQRQCGVFSGGAAYGTNIFFLSGTAPIIITGLSVKIQ